MPNCSAGIATTGEMRYRKGTTENDREAGYALYHASTFGKIHSGVIRRAIGRWAKAKRMQNGSQ